MSIGPEGDPAAHLDGELFQREIHRVYEGPVRAVPGAPEVKR